MPFWTLGIVGGLMMMAIASGVFSLVVRHDRSRNSNGKYAAKQYQPLMEHRHTVVIGAIVVVSLAYITWYLITAEHYLNGYPLFLLVGYGFGYLIKTHIYEDTPVIRR